MPSFVNGYCKEYVGTKENAFPLQILYQILHSHKTPKKYFKLLLFSAFNSSWKLKKAN